MPHKGCCSLMVTKMAQQGQANCNKRNMLHRHASRQTSCSMAHNAQSCTPWGRLGTSSALLQLLEEHVHHSQWHMHWCLLQYATSAKSNRPAPLPCLVRHSSFMMHKNASRPVCGIGSCPQCRAAPPCGATTDTHPAQLSLLRRQYCWQRWQRWRWQK